MFYTTQPMELPRDMSLLEATFECIKAETQLLYSSDYPHWDFDLPSTIYDLPFLNEKAKRNILGGNAVKLFNLQHQRPEARQSGLAVIPGTREAREPGIQMRIASKPLDSGFGPSGRPGMTSQARLTPIDKSVSSPPSIRIELPLM